MNTTAIAIRIAHAQDRIESNERTRETFREACKDFPGLFRGDDFDKRAAHQRRRIALLTYALREWFRVELRKEAALDSFRNTIRSARTRPVDLPTDLTCDKVNQQEEQYLQGTNETTA